MKSFKQHSNQMLSGTDSPAITLQRIQMKQMHLMSMRMSERSGDQIQYHNSREQLHRLKNVPDVRVPMLDKERNITGGMNEAKMVASSSDGSALSSAAGLGRTVSGGDIDFAVPLFLRKGINPRIKMVQRWDADSKDVKELVKEMPKLKDHLRTVKGVGSKEQTQLAREWNETMAPTMVWMEGWAMGAKMSPCHGVSCFPTPPHDPWNRDPYNKNPLLKPVKPWAPPGGWPGDEPGNTDEPFYIKPEDIPLPYDPFADDDGDGVPNYKDPNPNDPTNPDWENPFNPYIKPYNPFTDPVEPVEPFTPSIPFDPIHHTPSGWPITPLLARGAGDKEREAAASTVIIEEIKKVVADSKKIQVPDDMRDKKKVSIFIKQTVTNINDIKAAMLDLGMVVKN
jgi:hypothetical protein